ncbi:MAG: phosphatidylglycerol lysyltransferase domain-containing protein [Pirellulaceae bacterium]
MQYLTKYGSHCMAYSTLQPGMAYFDLPGVGYIAYVRYLGTSFILSDPVCAPDQLPALIVAFLRQHRSPFFVQVHEHTAGVLQREYGFRVNAILRLLKVNRVL